MFTNDKLFSISLEALRVRWREMEGGVVDGSLSSMGGGYS